MFRYLFLPLAALLLTSCGNQPAVPAADAPTATVVMRDGTRTYGKVVASSPSEIRIADGDKPPRIIPMSLVRRVEYEEPKPAPAAAAAVAEAPHEDHARPTAAAVTTRTNELPVGTEIVVRNEETIDSGKAVEGQRFAADVVRDVKDKDGDVVIPRGSNAQIVILSASGGGKFRGKSDLVLDLDTVSIDGRLYQVSTATIGQKGKDGIGANKRTATHVGGGAAIGAIIGAIAGGGKGAAIGAGAGAGGGALAEVLTKGGAIKVPVETRLTFRLDRPLRVVEAQ